MLPARSREVIANQIAYHEHNIWIQHWKKVDKYKEYAAVKMRLQTEKIPKEKRSLKKRLIVLEKDHSRIQSQEVALETGLVPLRIEMRNSIARELARAQTYCPSPVWDPPRPDTPLDAKSPPFVPQSGFFSDWKDAGQLEKVDETGEESGNERNGTLFDGGIVQGFEGCVSPSTRVPTMPDADEEVQEPLRRRSFDDGALSLTERRLSLPYIPTEWI
ncbi:unnamed protein product [Clonostachys rosea]|uniref:Uncharacterized protein n=1 Tax=Bionectria ochroleuca TaxID=29856 RepID=A0ABY6UU83_BIOOC|nr:unnamed protein product [Clonostachys rosea]